jgi:HEAT repeats
MRKPIAIVTALLLAGIVGLLLWRASGPREPVFEGRSLTSWLDHHVASSAASPPYGSPGWQKADEAIRQIGTNAIPTLLMMIRAKDRPPFILKSMEAIQRLGIRLPKYRYARARHDEAEYAFRMLGTNAVSAVPELIQIYEENVSPSSHWSAAMALGHVGRGAQAALPALLRNFTHTNSDVRFYAVSAAINIGSEPEVMIPVLTRALQDANVNVRWNALAGLIRFGRRAQSAVPEILKMLHDPGMVGSSSIIQQVETALWRIAPEHAGKPLVVEDATPMIANGVTTQAVKALDRGQKRILMKTGRTVPALAQYWSSDPRSGLTLYRGASDSDEADHVLGHFEVLDVPESENVNISTLCIVANGQILLNARDNTREVFLRIWRADTETKE